MIHHHLVTAGDTLSAITRRYNTTIEAVRLANRQIADINLIRVGDVLHVPEIAVETPVGWAEWYAGRYDFATIHRDIQVTGETGLREALRTPNTRVIVRADITLTGDVWTAANDVVLEGDGRRIRGGALKFGATRVIVSGLTVGPQGGTNTDCLTFREPSEIQVFAVRRCTLEGATDGGLDVIWNDGHDVYGTVEGCTFTGIDKASLVHSGDDWREGGRYHMTYRGNTWQDCYQRMPMVRDCDLHSVGDVIVGFGDPTGAGNGIQVSRNSNALIEQLTVTPRTLGSSTFDGSTVTRPRVVAAKATDLSARVRIVDPVLHGGAQVLEQNPGAVVAPPYVEG